MSVRKRRVGGAGSQSADSVVRMAWPRSVFTKAVRDGLDQYGSIEQ